MTCLYLAIKLHSPTKMSSHGIASLVKGSFTAQDIEAAEIVLMTRLDWHLFPPTALAFVENLFPLVVPSPHDEASAAARELARFLVELSVGAYPCSHVRPSVVARAAVQYSLEVVGRGSCETDATLRGALPAPDTSEGLEEAETCGRLLRRLHWLAMPGEDANPHVPSSDEESERTPSHAKTLPASNGR